MDALGDVSKAIVIEIGPGKGAITRLLSARTGHLIAIEFDRVLSAQLRIEYGRQRNVEILEADVLRVDFNTLVRGDLQGTRLFTDAERPRAHVIGNLPYYITSDILLKLFEFHRNFDILVIMLQKEVADRVAAEPGSRDYGLLSANAQMYARVEKLFTLPPGAFSPPPKVHSTVLRLQIAPQSAALQVEPAPFIDFLKLSFAQKRKTLLNNLKQRYPEAKIREAIAATKLRADVRSEAVPLAQMAQLFRSLET